MNDQETLQENNNFALNYLAISLKPTLKCIQLNQYYEA